MPSLTEGKMGEKNSYKEDDAAVRQPLTGTMAAVDDQQKPKMPVDNLRKKAPGFFKKKSKKADKDLQDLKREVHMVWVMRDGIFDELVSSIESILISRAW